MRDWLAYRARATPGATALVDAGTEERFTFADLDDTVDECAGRLAALGVGVDDHVGMVVESRPAAVNLVHAVARVGAVLVPLSTSLTTDELEPRVERADLELLVCERDTAERVEDLDVPVTSVDGDGEFLGEHPTTFDLPEWKLDDTLLMLYTSGTTGRPKLVRLTPGNLLTSACASAVRLGTLPDDTWCSPLSLSSMGGLAPVYRTVLYGTTLLLAPPDTDGLLDALSEYRPTGVSLVPVVLRRLLDAGDLPDSLRFVLLGGAHTPPALVERCEERSVPVCPTYGMTEAASQIATARPGEAAAHPGTVGRPLLFTTVEVVDDQTVPVAVGERGELVVRGPTVTPGYYDDPVATADAFCGLGFRTGDLGYVDEDGYVRVEGRVDDRINTGGQTVDPAEVAAVLREHPGVADAVVVGIPDEEWGERVGALVDRADDDPQVDGPTDDDLREFCRERLAAYKLPRVLAFGALPRTESGTADRDRVRERLLE